jgi:hypothetical protein
MAIRPHADDIRIGPDEWIIFGDLADGQSRAIPIDPYLGRVLPFLESLETECLAGCCGISAFALYPEEIRKAIAGYGPGELETLSSNLAALRGEIEGLPSDTVVSTRLNQFFRKVVFGEIVAHLHRVVESLRNGLRGHPPA